MVDGLVPLIVNDFGKGDQKKFLIEGSETSQSIPSVVWMLIIGFTGWVVNNLITYLSMKEYYE